MRTTASILHLDLDAFFAAVEQRDKPSLKGKPVCVGGTGHRGVVSTASYEARVYGARSAMPTAQARRLCPAGTAFLSPRFGAYSRSSEAVMGLLHELSPVVQQVSVDEAYVDLAAAGIDLTLDAVTARVRRLLDDIPGATGGLTASAGVASSKMLAKIASDLDKPAGLVVVPPGQELDVLGPLPVRAIGGIGPATATRLRTFGVESVADLQRMGEPDLVSIFGDSHGRGIYRLARAQDDRAVETEREAKSVSAEETFEVDVTDPRVLAAELATMSTRVTSRLAEGSAFARTVTIKVRQHDFTTSTRSATLPHPTGEPEVIRATAQRLLDGVDVSDGLRLLGVGVSGFTTHAQEQFLFEDEPADVPVEADVTPVAPAPLQRSSQGWAPGADVRHDVHGAGWVWGRGLGRVTVRFEGPGTPPGPVRTFVADDPALHPADPPDWTR
ncbi:MULTISPECIES: DNA polymerase IV [unclassified Allobranchiibius]|uniref:DNA polymerase IV n=1 Tax=unclassified Allobranchiibius TaxID=2649857 RepID=UPI001AA11093|nr:MULTISPECIES: DNA polymerase IV [unclassified Allobranchiibius]MBO1766490.1 DNA polymerase IV [Allobranchiibius sp. GilTou38]UIJ33913.1 DNA polymerase IV [Allobranchiibius sp. GilTou73]